MSVADSCVEVNVNSMAGNYRLTTTLAIPNPDWTCKVSEVRASHLENGQCLIFERLLPPHPSPLPEGKGEWSPRELAASGGNQCPSVFIRVEFFQLGSSGQNDKLAGEWNSATCDILSPLL